MENGCQTGVVVVVVLVVDQEMESMDHVASRVVQLVVEL